MGGLAGITTEANSLPGRPLLPCSVIMGSPPSPCDILEMIIDLGY